MSNKAKRLMRELEQLRKNRANSRPATEGPAPRRVLDDLREKRSAPIQTTQPTLLYWAYGSNLCINAMKHRCPGAVKLQALTLDDGALVFRGVADVVHREGSTVPGGLWLITDEHERTLDTYEGVRSRLYLKRYLTLLVKGEKKRCLYYQMSMSRGVMPPCDQYLQVIAEGYEDFGLPLEKLDTALRDSWNDKKVTESLRRRHEARGSAKLARDLFEPVEEDDACTRL